MPEIKQENIAYVASTLPIQIIRKMAREWRVGTILVASSALEKSYMHLNSVNHGIRIIVVPKNTITQIAHLTYHILTAKLLNRHIYFFHECCCLFFDVIIGFIKPNASHLPQVSLNSFEKINFLEAGSGRVKLLLNLLRLRNKFVPYLMDLDNNNGTCVIWARSKYPKSTKIFTIEDSNLLKLERNQPETYGRSNNILLLIGTDVVQSDTLKSLYLDIACRLSELNYNIYVKDHPNPESRLNLVDNRLIDIDPSTPVELINEDFDFVIGTASTGLLFFKNRAVSVLHLIENTNENLLKRRMLHLTSMPGGEEVNFPSTLGGLTGIVENNGRFCE